MSKINASATIPSKVFFAIFSESEIYKQLKNGPVSLGNTQDFGIDTVVDHGSLIEFGGLVVLLEELERSLSDVVESISLPVEYLKHLNHFIKS